jgi:hypothetical protein
LGKIQRKKKQLVRDGLITILAYGLLLPHVILCQKKPHTIRRRDQLSHQLAGEELDAEFRDAGDGKIKSS